MLSPFAFLGFCTLGYTHSCTVYLSTVENTGHFVPLSFQTTLALENLSHFVPLRLVYLGTNPQHSHPPPLLLRTDRNLLRHVTHLQASLFCFFLDTASAVPAHQRGQRVYRSWVCR